MSRLTAIRNTSAQRPAYDEAKDRQGHLRPAYRGVFNYIDKMSKAERRRFDDQARVGFSGENGLYPMPRVVTAAEADLVRRAVEQRGTALRMFLQDYYSGRKTYQKIIPEYVVQRIVERHHMQGFVGRVRPEHIAFPYGPDLLRAGNGVLGKPGELFFGEDNIGNVGGPGDIVRARELLFQLNPGLKRRLRPVDDPREYFRTLAESARKRALPPNGLVVHLSIPPINDTEDLRLRGEFKRVGIETVTPNSKRQMVVRDDGVYVRDGKKLERVGYVFLGTDHIYVEGNDPATRQAYLVTKATEALEDKDLTTKQAAAIQAALNPEQGSVDLDQLANALRRAGQLSDEDTHNNNSAPGLLDAILAGKVATNFTPGTEFVDDKEFKGYVDRPIRFYLGEKPLLRSIPVTSYTKVVRGRIVADSEKIDRIFRGNRWKRLVFKPGAGRSGQGLHIGNRMTLADRRAVEKAMREHPDSYITEPLIRISTLDQHIVDMRPLALVQPSTVDTSPTFFARGAPQNGDGKVNMGQKGTEFAAVVVKG